MTEFEKMLQQMQRKQEIMQYYLEQRDQTFRQHMEKMNLGLAQRTNLDTQNLAILEAELKNLLLGNNPTPQEKARIEYLNKKIAQLKDSGITGGNQNTQPRPDKK